MAIYMENPQNNLFRYERKYLLKKINLNKFLAELFKNNYKKIYKKRFINNIYYDTYNYDLLNHNIEGLSERKKIRIRWYGQTFGLSKKTIELKIKSEFLNTKKTLSIGKFKINSFEEITKFNDYVIDNVLFKNNFEFYNEIINKIPVILNRYERSYYLSPKNDVRVTIDSDLNFYSPITKIKSFENNIVVEIKYKNDVNFSNNFNNLTLTRYSKYAKGLLQNTFYKPNY
jgi:SPX domain protein involved in polyphosphate accumulation